MQTFVCVCVHLSLCSAGKSIVGSYNQDQLASRIRTDVLILLVSSQQNLYDIYHCCVYSEKFLVMDRGTV